MIDETIKEAAKTTGKIANLFKKIGTFIGKFIFGLLDQATGIRWRLHKDKDTEMKKGKVVDIVTLLKNHPEWPTHRHGAKFWEELGLLLLDTITFGQITFGQANLFLKIKLTNDHLAQRGIHPY